MSWTHEISTSMRGSNAAAGIAPDKGTKAQSPFD